MPTSQRLDRVHRFVRSQSSKVVRSKMLQRYLVAAIGIVIGLCIPAPSRSEVRVPPTTAEKVPGSLECDSPDANRRHIAVETVPSGIWRGFTVFKISCGDITGQLFFGKRGNSLRYVLMRAHQDSDAVSIPTWLRSQMLQKLLERSFDVAGRQPRYSFATSAFPEIGARLAAASAESSSWDRKTGHARHTTTGHFAQCLMNEQQTYPELADVFGTLGYNLRVGGTEDILVLPVARMNASDKQFIKVHLLPSDKLPVSAATYFTVEKR
jgi:hypothetical protein